MSLNILLLHGPNLNLLGKREPDIYGHATQEQIIDSLRSVYGDINLNFKQSNSESELIDILQIQSKNNDGILINPGAFSHTSIAIADAIRSISVTVICVHISNILIKK